ncbi:hypothetical protein VTN02DRAFT_181 [Thermoascus thermophilus]
MESQDGISVRPMRLKVLYTFDDESKTNCLARWPHLLDIQTAYLDEHTQIGVIELKTCIQAIVSASPELVAKLGQDYTVYAYDYSEYETPLVGQGMLSWVLASASPTPNAPAHHSKTIVTGRVCKNVLGLFSKGAQETLEVKLRLVPVPTVLQSEYLESMQKYRELSSIIPHDFDAQAWTSFIQQNPGLLSGHKPQLTDRTTSPIDPSGIEKFHQLLSAGSAPRDILSRNGNEDYQAHSPAQSTYGPPSRTSTPGGQRQHSQQQQHNAFRPSSRASTRDVEFQRQPSYTARRGSMQSGYGSAEESGEQQPRKRAKVFRAEWPEKADFNIERQPGSLRVAASTAASVRIHRPTPVNPPTSSVQRSNEGPDRPPTPMSRPTNELARRIRPPPSLLRESSRQSSVQYTSPYPMGDDRPSTEPPATSPEEGRYQGIFEPTFNMPSSPPVMDSGFPNRSSPVLPPLPMDHDSGFMSGPIEDLLDDDACPRMNAEEDAGTPLDECRRATSNDNPREEQSGSGVATASPLNLPSAPGHHHHRDNYLPSDGLVDQSSKEQAPPLPQQPTRSRPSSRPSSRASTRQTPKPLAPAPMSRSEVEQLMQAIPASDPVLPPSHNVQHPHSWAGPMSDLPNMETPAPQRMEEGKVRSGAGARRMKQVQARLDKCIRDGQVPPYCENCGAIETPTWRRAWSKDIEGSEQEASEYCKDPTMLFWQVLEKDEEDRITKFKIFKKTLADTDNDFVQILLCNPCGLWLHKFKNMRPENKWNKPPKDKRKRPSRNRKGPLSNGGTATRSRSKAQAMKPAESSPGPTDASSPAAEEGVTPRVDNDHDNDGDMNEPPSKRRRANSVEPRRSTDTVENRWQEQDAMQALRRAIQSSPARNLETRNIQVSESNLTPKPVRRTLFPSAHEEGPMKELGESLMNSPRRSPRVASRGSESGPQDKENQPPQTHDNDNLDDLFECSKFEFEPPSTPTPKRRTPRLMGERRNSLPFTSPTVERRKDESTKMTPTRLTAERLQRAQGGSSGLTPRGYKVNKHFGDVPDLPSVHGDSPRLSNYEVIDGMIMDIFDEDAASVAQTDSFYPFEPPKCPASGNWADWVPSDYVSPVASDAEDNREERRNQGQPGPFDAATHDDSEDLINAILSDPSIHKENLHNSQFGPMIFSQGHHDQNSELPDSGFFSSDLLNPQNMDVGAKAAEPRASDDDKQNAGVTNPSDTQQSQSTSNTPTS